MLDLRLAFAVAAAAAMLAGPALADSCDRLWFERNEMYADAGYCFKTPRARAAFGPRCYPPFGELSPGAQRRANALKAEEAALGCSE